MQLTSPLMTYETHDRLNDASLMNDASPSESMWVSEGLLPLIVKHYSVVLAKVSLA